MSSIEDRAKDILKDEINQLIELQDEGIRLTERKTEIVERMARKLEASGMEPDKISATIKRILKQNYIEISDKTVERACGIDKKRKYFKSDIMSDFQQPVTVASDGSESAEPDLYEGEPETRVPTPLEVSEQATEIALSLSEEFAGKANDLETRLKEALALADDKDKRIYQLEMQAGELEVQLAEVKKNPSTANIDKTEDMQIENDNMKQTIIELQEALRANVKASGFTQASHLPKQVWIAAINAINFYRELNKASRFAIEHNDPWKKIVFEVATDGQLKAAKLES